MIENAWVAWLILLLPIAAFVIIGLLGRWLRDGSGYVAVAAMLGSLVLSLYVFVQVLAQGAIGGNFAAQTIAGYVWLPSIPGNEIRISILIDNLSSLMLVLVSFLCLLIFIYSLGYMHEEEGKPRYYAEVSLFATGMLGTVSADNFLQLLIFWEIMGLCSYLLIGFWYHKPEAAAAAKKAFLVTRVGDVLLLVAVLIIWNEFHSLRFDVIAPQVGLLNPQLLTLIPLLFFGVGAGAYVMATQASRGEEVSSAGYGAALYHLFNHAFFKALLFLSAGSVIHAVNTNDMREMGGLSKAMPTTSKVMLFGSLALAGIVPFSGFFSKGEILSVTFDAGADHPGFYLLYAFGIVTAFLTAFYAFRLWFMTFHGEYRGHEHPHESPRVMTAPLMILAGFTLVSGLLAYPMQGFGNLVFFGRPEAGFPLVGIPWSHYVLEGAALGVAVLGIALAWSIYATKRIPAERFTATRGGAFLHRMLARRYWIDDVYDAFGRNVVVGLARGLDWFDRNVIDGSVNAVGRGGMRVAVQSDVFDRRVIDGAVNAVSLETIRTSWRLRQRQTGQVQSYAWVIGGGLVVLVFLMFGQGRV